MDILKVLSRGTKKTSKAIHNGSHSLASLPSAGAKPNPQLFHDDVRGHKRKRPADEPGTQNIVELPEVDFFAPKDGGATEAQPGTAREVARAPSPEAIPTRRLSDDECRQLMRSHRLKATLMSKHEDSSRVKKSKKKKKTPAVEAKKGEKKQLLLQPLASFGELRSTYGISRTVSENLAAQAYRMPTEVQLGCLPLLLRPELATAADDELEQGVDLMAVAPTGSGKTIGFLIPAIDHIMRARGEDGSQDDHELGAVVVAPTRELAFQIANEGRKLLEGTGLKIVSMRKGMRVAVEAQDDAEDPDPGQDDVEDSDREPSEEAEAADGKQRPVVSADILVTTPGLLLNHLTSGPDGSHKTLATVRDLILDEADVLLDPLFREQTLGVWDACTSPELRISCWSATMGSNVEALVTEKLKSRAEALDTTPRPLVRLIVGLKDTAVPNITHRLVYTASEQGKLLALRQLLHPTSAEESGPPLRPPFLVFTQTIDRATSLYEELKFDIPLEAGGAARIAALHGGLPDAARAVIMRKFRAGDIWVLITTDVLARGVDFAGVNGVVSYDVPNSSAAYVHRAGRTGRAGREGGVAVTLYTKEDIPFVKTVANVIAASERQAGRTGPEAGVQKWLLDALPDVSKAERRRVRERGGAEARRSGGKAMITSQSGYERRRQNNRQGAIEGAKKRKMEERRGGRGGEAAGDDDEWAGFGD